MTPRRSPSWASNRCAVRLRLASAGGRVPAGRAVFRGSNEIKPTHIEDPMKHRYGHQRGELHCIDTCESRQKLNVGGIR